MQLLLNQPVGRLHIRRATPDSVEVADRLLTSNFLLAPDALVDAWPVADLASLDAATAEPILSLSPALVLLATGPRQVFPPAAFAAAFLTRGIGIEVMDTLAAARTFNVLAAEDRRVVAAFWFPIDEVGKQDT
jgi:uncharacterized protein